MVQINKQQPPILVDLFHEGVFVATLTQWQQLDVREQISRYGYTGYSLFINQKSRCRYNLDVEKYEVKIDSTGEVNRWFPKYFHSKKYGFVDTFDEILSVVLQLRTNQINFDENNK